MDGGYFGQWEFQYLVQADFAGRPRMYTMQVNKVLVRAFSDFNKPLLLFKTHCGLKSQHLI